MKGVSAMDRPRFRAFTLVELLVVILMITILVALLMPALGSARDMVMQTQCANNLNRLWQAIGVCRSERAADAKADFIVPQWTGTLLAYLENQSSIYICPAAEAVLQGGQGAGASGIDYSGFIGSGNPGVDRQILPEMAEFETVWPGPYVSAMEPGPWVLKFSEEQYQEALSLGYIVERKSILTYDCTYKPGANPHIYWLMYEDHGDDYDYEDCMIKVTEESNGSVHLLINCGTFGHTNNLISKTDGHILLHLPSGAKGMQWTFKATEDGGVTTTPWDGTLSSEGSSASWVGSAATNYGMNGSGLKTAAINAPPRLTYSPGRIAMLDYPIHVADSSDNWSHLSVDLDGNGVPDFARHGRGSEKKINVLFTDGSVQAMRPEEIDPLLPSTEKKYWLP